jgi:sortase A
VTSPPCAARWLRRGAFTLLATGLSLLGWALAAHFSTDLYQARQERAFFSVSCAATPAVTPDPAQTADPDPLVLGRIEIPRIGVAAIVREGADDSTLAIAVGHILSTARPGERGNMALAGHRDSFFRALRKIRRQDTIRIVTQKRSWEYAVSSTEVVNPEDTWVLDPTEDTVLSLVTCYPFDYVGHAPKRFVVRASLVTCSPPAASAEEVSQEGSRPE